MMLSFFNEDTLQLFYSHNKDKFIGGVKTNVDVAALLPPKVDFIHIKNWKSYKNKRFCIATQIQLFIYQDLENTNLNLVIIWNSLQMK